MRMGEITDRHHAIARVIYGALVKLGQTDFMAPHVEHITCDDFSLVVLDGMFDLYEVADALINAKELDLPEVKP